MSRSGETWKAGDIVELDLPMPVERVYANPKVKMDVGRVCAEARPAGLLPGAGRQRQDAGRDAAGCRATRALKTRPRADLFDGIVAVVADAEAADAGDWDGDLYRPAPPREATAKLTAVPYYIWNNRGPNPMLVWIPE